jgi:hypothetical protein
MSWWECGGNFVDAEDGRKDSRGSTDGGDAIRGVDQGDRKPGRGVVNGSMLYDEVVNDEMRNAGDGALAENKNGALLVGANVNGGGYQGHFRRQRNDAGKRGVTV